MFYTHKQHGSQWKIAGLFFHWMKSSERSCGWLLCSAWLGSALLSSALLWVCWCAHRWLMRWALRCWKTHPAQIQNEQLGCCDRLVMVGGTKAESVGFQKQPPTLKNSLLLKFITHFSLIPTCNSVISAKRLKQCCTLMMLEREIWGSEDKLYQFSSSSSFAFIFSSSSLTAVFSSS